jgi:hypothetical protein
MDRIRFLDYLPLLFIRRESNPLMEGYGGSLSIRTQPLTNETLSCCDAAAPQLCTLYEVCKSHTHRIT